MRKAKYRNKPKVLNGIKFDSQKEAKRYQELKLLERAGKIKDLEVQPKFSLVKGVKFSNDKRAKPDLRYFADFAYTDMRTGERVVEDVKSVATKESTVYKMKRHMMLAIHGIEVREI